jgi:hypothetical protein
MCACLRPPITHTYTIHVHVHIHARALCLLTLPHPTFFSFVCVCVYLSVFAFFFFCVSVQDVAEDYTDLRKEHYDGLKDRRYVSLAAARAGRLALDFKRQPAPVRPSFLGTRVLRDVNIASLLPYIDWSPFFAVWQLRGKYPNRGYPKIFNDATVGP